MSTKRLKKRDRSWAEHTVLDFQTDGGRDWHSKYYYRLWNTGESRRWERGQDKYQQEALNITKP